MSDNFWTARTLASIPTPQCPADTLCSTIYGLHSLQHVKAVSDTYHAYGKLRAAWERNDRREIAGAGLSLAAYSSQATIGAASAGIRSVTIASTILPTNAGLATALTFLSAAGNYLFSIVYGLYGFWFLYENCRARAFYDAHLKDGTFTSLKQAVFIPASNIEKWVDEEGQALRVKGVAALEKADYETLPSDVEWVPNDLDPSDSDFEEQDRKLDEVLCMKHFQEKYPELSLLKAQYFSKLEDSLLRKLDLPTAIGLLLKLREQQLTNEAGVIQAVGTGCLEKIKKAATRGLEARLKSPVHVVKQSANKELAKLNAEIQTQYEKNIKMNRLVAIMGLGGLIVGALVFLTGPQAFLLAVFGLTLTLAFFCDYVNFSVLKEAFTDQPGTWDKKLIVFLAAFLIASMVSSIVFCTLFHGSWIALGVLLTFSIVALCVYGYAYHKVSLQEKKWKEDHPSLQDFAKHLEQYADQTQRVDKETLEKFKKLPKDIRLQVTDAAQDQDSSRYEDIDLYDELGEKYLEYYFQKVRQRQKLEAIEIEQLGRAVKKTAKFFWIQSWYANKNHFLREQSLVDIFKEQALLLEELRESILRNDLRVATRAYQKIDPEIRNMLHENIRKILKREESVESLSRAVRTVMQAPMY